MEFGCSVPYTDAPDLASFVPRAARAIEARGFESLWVGEHTHLPVASVHPDGSDASVPERYRRFPDPWSIITLSAAVTSRIRLGTLIALVAEHNPLVLAKVIATADQLSGGRVEVGVGYGWNPREMVNNGIDPTRKRAILREKVSCLRALWSGEPVGFDGEFVSFSPSWSLPTPTQRPGPKVHYGCAPTPRNLADVVAVADGFAPMRALMSEDSSSDIRRLRRLAEENDRDPASIEISIAYPGTSWGSVDLVRFTRRLPSAAALESHASIGVERVICSIPAGPDDLFERALDAWYQRAGEAGVVASI
jgi:probable F420-dependent oxidoreductase